MRETPDDMTAGTAPMGTLDYIRFVKSTGGGNYDSELLPLGYLQQSLNTPNGFMMNGTLSPTAAGGTLTLAVKTLSGGDPGASDMVLVNIGGAMRAISAPLSVSIAPAVSTFNAGSSGLATNELDLFGYMSYRAASGAVVLGASRIPYARLYSDFNGTATHERYAAFSTAPASSDSVAVVGRFAATLSGGAGYTWTVPTFTSANLIQAPTHETRPLIWSPVFTAAGSMTFSLTSTFAISYQLVGRNMFIDHFWRGTTGGTASATIYASSPLGGVSELYQSYGISLNDGGATVGGYGFPSPTGLLGFSRFDGGNWGIGASRDIIGSGRVRIG